MEQEVITQCKQGNLDEFGKLYDEYVKKIYQFIYFKTHNRETAEDLTSHTFMKALENISSFNEKKASFKTWLYKIARNTIIDHYRTDRPTSDIDDAWGVSDKVDIERDTDMQMKVEAVQKYMEKLKPEQRELILLRVWGGNSFSEIAEITGKSEASCKMMFKRVMEKLRDDFAPLMILLLLIKY
ncbi:RNA polymerase sigma factor [candidate division KSB1 bacterium]